MVLHGSSAKMGSQKARTRGRTLTGGTHGLRTWHCLQACRFRKPAVLQSSLLCIPHSGSPAPKGPSSLSNPAARETGTVLDICNATYSVHQHLNHSLGRCARLFCSHSPTWGTLASAGRARRCHSPAQADSAHLPTCFSFLDPSPAPRLPPFSTSQLVLAVSHGFLTANAHD